MKPLTLTEVPETFDWSAAVAKHDYANVYAAKKWGDYKARVGWKSRRIIINDHSGRRLGLIQYQERKRGPARFVLAQGCPILTETGTFQAKEVFEAFITHLDLGRLDLLGIKYHQFESAEAKLALLAHGFRPVISAKDHTLEVDLSRNIAAIRSSLDARWRNALAKAERKESIEIRFVADPSERLRAFDAFARMYAVLQERKGFRNNLNTGVYRDLAAHDEFLEFQEVFEGGETILVRIIHKSQNRWTDFYVASNERARALDVPRLALWRALERAKQEGATIYDLGGIDPPNNRGVFVFKAGVTRSVAQATPLWLHSRSAVVRDVAASILGRR
ncbi:GNAT family N-acetyltransferase [Methylorubrum extorquens]|uniref:GNAT family N-acetyltransferase n=1 Tax=Methylorubrum extorquens TaxID=408 RepID=UPI001EE59C1E|nr:GNAT family N-acetyltransferase [Methylorubrum extorquens]MCG5245992.1 GNAT family N-acetyltransferase [Methylorubrum extorquens]